MNEFRAFLISENCDIPAKLVEFCHWGALRDNVRTCFMVQMS